MNELLPPIFNSQKLMVAMKNFYWLALFTSSTFFVSCTKEMAREKNFGKIEAPAVEPKAAIGEYVLYTIAQGAHYADLSGLKSIKLSEMKFGVRFDSSAVYTTIDPHNQSDINKLYGFSEGLNNQYNSARIGWNWYNNKLNLYAYVYKKGVRSFKKITSVAIGAEHTCSIKVSGTNYIFTVNGVSITLSRANKTSTASGFRQYPYFGGDETAPHEITIRIKDL